MQYVTFDDGDGDDDLCNPITYERDRRGFWPDESWPPRLPPRRRHLPWRQHLPRRPRPRWLLAGLIAAVAQAFGAHGARGRSIDDASLCGYGGQTAPRHDT